jgi:hypothetical protein
MFSPCARHSPPNQLLEEIKTSRLRYKPGLKGIVDILSETGHKLRPLSHEKQIQQSEEASRPSKIV